MLKTSHLGQNGTDIFSKCGTKDYQEKIILTYELCNTSCVKEGLEGDTTALVAVSLANFMSLTIILNNLFLHLVDLCLDPQILFLLVTY